MIKKTLVVLTLIAGVTFTLMGTSNKPDYTNQDVLSPTQPQQANVAVLLTPQTEVNVQLVKAKKEVKPLAVDADRTLHLNFAIQGGFEFEAFKASLIEKGKSKEPIFIMIDSPGGSVILGNQLLSLMEAADGPVYTVCMRFCASMAAIILEYGTKRFALDRSVIMFHDAAGGLEGSLEQMNGMLQFYRKMVEKTNRHIAQRSNMTLEKFLSLESHELWIDSEDAKNLNLLDDLVKLK